MTKQILLISASWWIREGLKRIVADLDPGYALTGIENESEATGFKVESLALIVLDFKTPELNELPRLEILRKRFPKIPLVVLAESRERSDVFRVLASGADGYVPKSMSREMAVTALNNVLSGGDYVPLSFLSKTVVKHTATSDTIPRGPRTLDRMPNLTPREYAVLGLLTEGCTNDQIANKLAVRPSTVKVHVKNILNKFGVENRTQAAVFAQRMESTK